MFCDCNPDLSLPLQPRSVAGATAATSGTRGGKAPGKCKPSAAARTAIDFSHAQNHSNQAMTFVCLLARSKIMTLGSVPSKGSQTAHLLVLDRRSGILFYTCSETWVLERSTFLLVREKLDVKRISSRNVQYVNFLSNHTCADTLLFFSGIISCHSKGVTFHIRKY